MVGEHVLPRMRNERGEAGVELFHAPGDGDGHASIQVDGHRETWPVRSTRFKSWLRREFHARLGKAVRAQVLTDALGAIEAKAAFDGPEHEVALRVAAHDGQVYVFHTPGSTH